MSQTNVLSLMNIFFVDREDAKLSCGNSSECAPEELLLTDIELPNCIA